MFKWKVSGLGSKKDKGKQQLNNDPPNNLDVKSPKVKDTNKKEKSKDGDASQSPRNRGFKLFQSSSSSTVAQSTSATSTGTGNLSKDAMSRVGQRLAMPQSPTNNNKLTGLQFSNERIYNDEPDPTIPPPLPPLNPLKPSWRNFRTQPVGESAGHQGGTFMPQDNGHTADDEEEAIPSDSLYGYEGQNSSVSTAIYKSQTNSWDKRFGSRQSLTELAHWSSHGYLAKGQAEGNKSSTFDKGSGYVVLKKQGNSLVTSRNPRTSPQQPLSLPVTGTQFDESGMEESKYCSVRGYKDFKQKHNDIEVNGQSKNSNFEPPQYHHPPMPAGNSPYKRPPPPLPNDPHTVNYNKVRSQTNLQSQMSSSVSWGEWTQQLQAYIAWVNSQLRKKENVKPIQDLRSDLQSGEVLAQLIHIISGDEIAGIIYQPESLQGMRENLERVLHFMSSKKIRMHQITSKEILEGNLKAVMRLILALAAHYKPQSVKHHDVSVETGTDLKQEQEPKQKVCDDIENGNNNVKRTPSLNDSHYSSSSNQRLGPDPGIVPSQIYPNEDNRVEPTKPLTLPKPVVGRGLKDDTFVRTGSGRKLPRIPDKSWSVTLPRKQIERNLTTETNREEPNEEPAYETKEAQILNQRKTNTMSNKPKALEFWESMENIERNDFRYNTIHRISTGRRLLPRPPGDKRSLSFDESSNEAEKLSLSSSFSGAFQHHKSDNDSSVPPSPRNFHKMPPDGASLQSHNSETFDSRGEVEGSSNNNSPPASVVQGGNEGIQDADTSKGSTTLDWIRGTFERGSDKGRKKWGSPSPVTSVGPDFLVKPGTSSPNKKKPEELDELKSTEEDLNNATIPYNVLLHDLSQAKRQLMELHGKECTTCDSMAGSETDLQERILEQETSIANLKQTLLRTTLAKQEVQLEKNELKRQIEELTARLNGLRIQNKEKDETIFQFRRLEKVKCDLKSIYNEELFVARDAIANLRSSFNNADPNQHILDTLEQCVSIIVEKLVNTEKPESRLSNVSIEDENGNNACTKVIYFTPRSETPFMSNIAKALGDITLRDFKQMFDRPGFYRYHFKTMDQEFGMVKEEICDDLKRLPGVDGKIVVWVEEE